MNVSGHKNGEKVREDLLALGYEMQSLQELGSWFSCVRSSLDIKYIP